MVYALSLPSLIVKWEQGSIEQMMKNENDSHDFSTGQISFGLALITIWKLIIKIGQSWEVKPYTAITAALTLRLPVLLGLVFTNTDLFPHKPLIAMCRNWLDGIPGPYVGDISLSSTI